MDSQLPVGLAAIWSLKTDHFSIFEGNLKDLPELENLMNVFAWCRLKHVWLSLLSDIFTLKKYLWNFEENDANFGDVAEENYNIQTQGYFYKIF